MKKSNLKCLVIIMLINCICVNVIAQDPPSSWQSFKGFVKDRVLFEANPRTYDFNWKLKMIWDAMPGKNTPEGIQCFQCNTLIGVKFDNEKEYSYLNAINDLLGVAHEWHANTPGEISSPAGYSVGNYSKAIDYWVETEHEGDKKAISALVSAYGRIQIGIGVSVKGLSIALPPLCNAGHVSYNFIVHNGICCGYCDLQHDSCSCRWGLCPRCNEIWICKEHEGYCPGCRTIPMSIN